MTCCLITYSTKIQVQQLSNTSSRSSFKTCMCRVWSSCWRPIPWKLGQPKSKTLRAPYTCMSKASKTILGDNKPRECGLRTIFWITQLTMSRPAPCVWKYNIRRTEDPASSLPCHFGQMAMRLLFHLRGSIELHFHPSHLPHMGLDRVPSRLRFNKHFTTFRLWSPRNCFSSYGYTDDLAWRSADG